MTVKEVSNAMAKYTDSAITDLFLFMLAKSSGKYLVVLHMNLLEYSDLESSASYNTKPY